MLFLLSLAVRVFACLLGASGKDDRAKELEILVLRHQLRILQRTSGSSPATSSPSRPPGSGRFTFWPSSSSAAGGSS